MKAENRYEVHRLDEGHDWFGVFDKATEEFDGGRQGLPALGLVYRGTEIACHAWADAVMAALEVIEADDLADRTETAELEPVEAFPV